MSTTTKPRLFPPFRAEQIGSLKRPSGLIAKRKEFDAGTCTAADLEPIETEAVQQIVQLQREVGMKAMTDGEFRRHMFFDGVFDNMEGMKHLDPVPLYMLMDYCPDVAAFKKLDFHGGDSYVCEGKLRRTKPFYVSQFEALKTVTLPEEHKNLKLTMCAPEWYHLRHGDYAYNKDAYKNDDEYFTDVAAAYREELKALYAVGCRNIQFDDPLLAYFCAESMIKGMEELNIDHEALLETYIRAYNSCLEGRPADLNVGLHLCRGNFKDGKHFSEGGYDRIAAKLFKEINVDCYYLEYDTERAGTFEPLRLLPPNKVVVLGMISSKFPQLEDKQHIIARVHAAAEEIANGEIKRSKEEALNQICISPQCGFASHSEGNLIDDEAMRRKLSLVSEIAREIWPDA